MSKIMDLIKAAATSDGIKISAEHYATAKNMQAGAETIVAVTADVLEEMSPTDDTPLAFTWGEAFALATERLGAKILGGK